MVRIEKENIKREIKKICSTVISVRTSEGELIALSKVISFVVFCDLNIN